jgi:hypothetical protein
MWRFKQTVEYNDAAFLQRRTLDLMDDSLVAKHYFTVSGVWTSSHSQDSTSITGRMQLLSITHEGISLKLNLRVINLKTQNQFIYTGERMITITKVLLLRVF